MHAIGTHVINIQISKNTTIIYPNDLKITWNQVCTLRSASRLAHQSKTFPIIIIIIGNTVYTSIRV